MTPDQQIIARSKELFELAGRLYNLDLSKVGILFNLKGRAAGMACRRGNTYFMRFNRDMLSREAFDHLLNETVPHEIAHIICFMNPMLGRNHDHGWVRVCRALGGKGLQNHTEEVVYGKGYTYEYVTDRGHKVRIGDRHHSAVHRGVALTFKQGKGKVDQSCTYSIVGYQGRTLANPLVRHGSPVATPVPRPEHQWTSAAVQAIINEAAAEPKHVPTPWTSEAIKNAIITVTRVPKTVAPMAQQGLSKAAMARAVMLAGYSRGMSYEEIVQAIMAATGHDRQLSRAYYKGNYAKVGVPAPQ